MFYVRDVARQVLYRHLNERIQWDGRVILLLARASLSLLIPWELFRNETLRAAGDTQNPFRDLSQERDEWLKEVSDLRADAARILAAIDVMDRRLPERLARDRIDGDRRLLDVFESCRQPAAAVGSVHSNRFNAAQGGHIAVKATAMKMGTAQTGKHDREWEALHSGSRLGNLPLGRFEPVVSLPVWKVEALEYVVSQAQVPLV